MKPLLKSGYVWFHDKATPKLLAQHLKKEGCIGWCQCGKPAFSRWSCGHISCPECTQKAISHAAPYAQAAYDYDHFIEEGGKPS